MKYCFALLVAAPFAMFAQSAERMEALTPESFGGPLATVTEETTVTFRYGAKKSSNVNSHFGNNFTWFCKTDRRIRIYLSDSILTKGISIQVNPRFDNLVELSGALYSLAGDKVNKEKLGRKFFEKTPGDGTTVYRAMLTKTFEGDIFELNYEIERAYETESVAWSPNDLYGSGKARMEFHAPEYLQFDFQFLNLKAEDYTRDEENKAGYMTIEVFGDETGKWTLKKVNISYDIMKKIFVTQPSPDPRIPRSIVANLIATKDLKLR